ncbi:N-acetylglucosamine kinase [Streptomyces spiramenti]|uniref:N-acetylglucosamine kinase n=1 Tax=Streptomyces spiramenti TaxID=2720606 RepID=UPI0030843F9C
MSGWVLGVDSGGSGLRAALARPAPDGRVTAASTFVSRTPVRTGVAGIDAGHLWEQLLPALPGMLERAAREEDGAQGHADPPTVAAVCVGAAGMATLGDDLRARLPRELAGLFGPVRLALAADAVTGYAGALGERAGAVVAAGTGMIALGTDLRVWRRVDGWGHLLGDCGSGAWIGRAGLEAAMRAHDGRAGGSAALLAAARERFGDPASLPGSLYPRPDRPAVLASFAPSVAAAAVAGDAVATAVLGEAGRQIAETAAAACPGSGEDAVLALTGGLLNIGAPLLDPLHAHLDRLLPGHRAVAAVGGPLEGALLVAARLATDGLRLPADDALLRVV